MNVSLVSTTEPRINGLKTAEDLIVYIARVSNPTNQLNLNTGHKLIKYCLKHNHWSVFEQAHMTIEIVTSRAISAQILRHHSFKFQEFSQRYSPVTEVEPIELRKQATDNRQSSTEVILDEKPHSIVNHVLDTCKSGYNELLELGVAKECARYVLPMASQTTIYMTGCVRSWIHYIALRQKIGTQKEHRIVAEHAAKIFQEQFPVIYGAMVAIVEERKNKEDIAKSRLSRLLAIANELWINGKPKDSKSAQKWNEADIDLINIEKEIVDDENSNV